jgi:hypothetical protein
MWTQLTIHIIIQILNPKNTKVHKFDVKSAFLIEWDDGIKAFLIYFMDLVV